MEYGNISTMTVSINSRSFEMLSNRQKTYVDWLAGGQTLIDEEGKIESLTGLALSERLGVSRQALWKYRDIPGFWDIVRERRTELYGQDRMSLLYKALLAKGLKGDSAAIKLMMQQARVLEAERTEVQHSGTIGVAVVNYSDTLIEGNVKPHQVLNQYPLNKHDSEGEKAQKEKVPVPESITSHTQLSSNDSANGDTGYPDTASAVRAAAQLRREKLKAGQKVQNDKRVIPVKQKPLEGRIEVVVEEGKAPIHLKEVGK